MAAFGMSFIGYWISAFLVTMTLGVIWVAVEKHFVIHAYRYVYDFFHAVPMPATEERGLFYNRPTSQKRWIAGVLSIIESLYLVWSGHANPFAEMVAAVIEIPAFLIGFGIGTWLHPRLAAGKYIDKFDKMGDSLGTVQSNEVLSKARRMAASVLGWIPGRTPRESPVAEQKPVEQKPDPVPTPPAETPEDYRTRIDRFTKRGR